MNPSIPQSKYFEPVDRIAETMIQNLDEIKDEEIREYRRNFLAHYTNSMEINPKQKEWKKLLSQKPINQLRIVNTPTIKEFDSPKMPGSQEEFAGAANIEEDHIGYWIRRDLRQRDVRICHFDNAIREKLIKKEDIERIKKIENKDKFSLLALGGAEHSLCLSIPDDVLIENPFLIQISNKQPNVMMPIVINVFVGKRSNIKIIIEIATASGVGQPSMIPLEMHVFADNSSGIDLLEIQKIHPKGQLFPSQQFFLKENASLNYLLIEQGGEVVKRNLSFQLEGEDAAATLTGLYRLSGTQKFIFDTNQNHLASRTLSNLLFKGVLDGSSYSLWKGNVFVAKDTLGADGYQMNNNLLLNSSAHAESIPGLEIIADDVRCSHGVTLSDIDPDQLFYLESRGIDESNGVKLIVDGFTRDSLQRIRSDKLREYAMKELGFAEEF